MNTFLSESEAVKANGETIDYSINTQYAISRVNTFNYNSTDIWY